jgi:ZIP family zinc transporter
MPIWLQAGCWGGVAGGALLLGAAVGYRMSLPRKLIAGVMAFGSGVLISALSFDLMEEAFQHAGIMPTVIGFSAGALIYSGANALVSRQGARNRKRARQQPAEGNGDSGGTAIAVGALLDGIPESLAIGLTMLAGDGVNIATVAAIFISNIPEGLSSSAGMKTAGRSATFVFGLWLAIAVASGLASLAGYTMFSEVSVEFQAATTALAAGAILAMLSETMIPEAFEGTPDWAGIITCAGFACAFALTTFGE